MRMSLSDAHSSGEELHLTPTDQLYSSAPRASPSRMKKSSFRTNESHACHNKHSRNRHRQASPARGSEPLVARCGRVAGFVAIVLAPPQTGLRQSVQGRECSSTFRAGHPELTPLVWVASGALVAHVAWVEGVQR